MQGPFLTPPWPALFRVRRTVRSLGAHGEKLDPTLGTSVILLIRKENWPRGHSYPVFSLGASPVFDFLSRILVTYLCLRPCGRGSESVCCLRGLPGQSSSATSPPRLAPECLNALDILCLERDMGAGGTRVISRPAPPLSAGGASIAPLIPHGTIF